MGGEGMDTVAETPNSSSKERWVTVTTKKGRKSILTEWYDPVPGKTAKWNVTAIDVDLDIEKMAQAGYYNIFKVVDQDEIILTWVHHNMCFEVANIGAGMGGGFVNMQELRVMTYNKAINGPDGKRWKAEVENEYLQMVKSKVFKTVLKSDLPPGTKIIDSVWVMKKKSNGTLRGRINSRGFKQVQGQH